MEVHNCLVRGSSVHKKVSSVFEKKKYAHVMEVHICLVLGFIYLYKSYLMFHVQKANDFSTDKNQKCRAQGKQSPGMASRHR
jgi:hypothetical protein